MDSREDTPLPPRRRGRPKLGVPQRVRVTTTVEPSKLARLREHAQKMKKSLGQLADEYVREHFSLPADSTTSPESNDRDD